MQQPNRCPLCDAEIARTDIPCPRCGYHADNYNRALDDVALSFRLSMSDPHRMKASTTTGGTWFSAIPAWCKAHWPPSSR